MYKKILYVSWTGRTERPYFDPSVRYRCFNFAAELTQRGHSVQVISQEKFQKSIDRFGNVDHFIFHRPCLTEELAEFLVKPRGATLIADFDDLVFDVRVAGETPAVRTRREPMAGVARYLSKTSDAASLFSNFTSSTAPLDGHLRELYDVKTSLILNNCIDPGFSGLCKSARTNADGKARVYALGYFSGTSSHDADFAMIAPTVREYLLTTGKRLLLVGPVKIPQLLSDLSSQIETRPIVSFFELPNLMATCEKVLAPLEDTIFTRAKSGIKFMEAALTGCAVLATPIPDIDRFESPLLLKCRSHDDWTAALHSSLELAPNEREVEILRIEQLTAVRPHVDAWVETFIN